MGVAPPGLNWGHWEATGGSFSLPQNDVDQSAEQRQREGDPGQDVGVAEAALFREPIRTHHRVDDGAAHHKQTCVEKEVEGKQEVEEEDNDGKMLVICGVGFHQCC